MPSKSTLSARPLDVVDVWSWAAALAPPRNSSTALARAGLPAPTGVGAGGPPPKKSTASPWPLEAISDALAILAMPELLKLYKSSRSDAETLGDTLAVLGWEIPLPTLKPPKPLLFASREPGDACVTGTGGFGVEDLMPPTDRFIGPLLLLVFLNLSPKFELTKSAKLSPASIVATLMRCRLYALSHELAAELAATKAILHFQPHSRHGRLPPVDNSP
mmetsp:Transcript_11475/g.42003  ORF Transcript_11475/g.42003 Transcript_11475/m.42003 type:complete len:218 (+) Transcript_11475:1284-1937(+)